MSIDVTNNKDVLGPKENSKLCHLEQPNQGSQFHVKSLKVQEIESLLSLICISLNNLFCCTTPIPPDSNEYKIILHKEIVFNTMVTQYGAPMEWKKSNQKKGLSRKSNESLSGTFLTLVKWWLTTINLTNYTLCLKKMEL